MAGSGRRVALFLLIGIGLYGLVYGLAETVGAPLGEQNRFRMVQAAWPRYDFALLGASHMLPLGFQEMSQQLGEIVQGTVINLATPGGGILPNRLMLRYFLEEHGVGTVVYGVDSFAFYSREWNEERVQDTRLWQRAPFDPALLRVLWRATGELGIARGVFWNYLTGFSKINDPQSWWQADPWADDPRFGQVFQGPAYRYRQRIQYLYPGEPDEVTFQRYLDLFLAMIDELQLRGIGFVAFKPPLPEGFSQLIPHEERFNETLAAPLAARGVPFYDFTDAMPAAEFYFDTDHLNRRGVLQFFENHLGPVLVRHHPLSR